MNRQGNGMHDAVAAAPAVAAATRPLYWSVRRELWEYRSIYLAPLILAGVALLGFLIASIGRALTTSDLVQRRTVLEEPLSFATALILGAAFVVGMIYCMEALHAERRDRSILFWKSLPVSDLTVVLSKASIPFIVLPVVSFAITVATQFIMLVLGTLVLAGSSMDVSALWAHASLFRESMGLLYHLVTVHILWYAPIYTWMLLISAWARRATFLWVALPPAALCIIERFVFRTHHILALLEYRFSGPKEFDMSMSGDAAGHMVHSNLVGFLISPGLWIGLLLAVAFLAAAVRLRRCQGPI